MIKVIVNAKEMDRIKEFFSRISPKSDQCVLLDFTTNGKKLNIKYNVGPYMELESMLRCEDDG